MIDKIITAYLKNNKRLVVPDFGAFIHKEGEEVVFVEFLKKDDAVLTSLLRKEYAIDEHEALSAVGEYVTRIRRTVGATGRYVIEGLGSLHTDVNGLYALAFDPRVRKQSEDIEIPIHEEPAPVSEQPVMQVYTREHHQQKQTTANDSRNAESHKNGTEDEEVQKNNPNVIEFGFPKQKAEPKPKPDPIEKKSFTLNDLYSIPASDSPRGDKPRAAAQTSGGDRYAQPQRTPADRESMRQPVPERRARRDDEWEGESPQRRPVNRRKKKKNIGNIIMIIAIIIAALALGSIIYGMLTSGDINIKQTNPQIENTSESGTPEMVDGVVTEVELGGGV